MNWKKYYSVLLVFLMLFAHNIKLEAAEKITVGFGNALAPWVITKSDDGIIIDIIEHALTPLGYEIEKVYLPYARRLKSYKQGLLDVVSDINKATMTEKNLQGFLSDTAYTYINYAYSLKSQNYKFKSMKELANYRLLSWQGAVAHLGGEYAEMAYNNPLYSEHHDQSIQVKMLFLERVDVIQMDEQIFNYYRSKVDSQGDVDTTPKVDRFGFFGESPNSFLFRNLKIRDQFNQQLAKLRSSGKYQEIVNKYFLPDAKDADNNPD